MKKRKYSVPTRSNGYYRVKYRNQWIIALWITNPKEDYWMIPGFDEQKFDNDFDEINRFRITLEP